MIISLDEWSSPFFNGTKPGLLLKLSNSPISNGLFFINERYTMDSEINITQPTHVSVLLNESINGLAIEPNGVYIDGTFGRGGHSKKILEKLNANGRLIAIDRDPSAIKYARENIKDNRFEIEQGDFSNLKSFGF